MFVRLLARGDISKALDLKSYKIILSKNYCIYTVIITKASMLAEFFFALAIGSGMSCVP